jgi:HAD superfamily hydrolase (TIGR01509 family)
VSDPRDDTAVLFDMDGLLIDSEPMWLESETAVMARLGADWTERDQAALLGGSLDRTVRYLLAKATRPAPPEVVAEWLMSDIIARVRRGGVPVRPGTRELVAATAAAGLPTALVTSSERGFMDAVLASTGLRFGALVCADDVTATKPDPEPYLLAAKLLGVPPADCFALEDSPNGVASAEAAGCRVIAVPSLVPIPAGPGRTVVRSLLDLTADADGIRVRGLAPQTLRQLPPRLLHESHGEVRMSTYDKIAWLPLCGGLTGLGLVLSYLAMRRRGLGSGLRGAAWSLLPLAAYLTGAIEMFWRMGAAIGDFAKGFAFSVEVWSGIVVAGVAVVLFVVSGPLRRRVKQGQDRQAVGPASSAGAGKTAPAGQRELATRPAPAGATAPAPVPAKARKGKGAAGDDDDLGDVEDILRRHGIT